MLTLLLSAALAAQTPAPEAVATEALAPVVIAPVVIAEQAVVAHPIQPDASQAAAAPVVTPPSPEAVMAIPEALRQMLQAQVIAGTHSGHDRLTRLSAFMFGANGLGIQYDQAATSTVADAFQTRKANCLTFTLLAVALAREAGLDAHPQEIERTLSWDNNGDNLFVQNMHVNAGVSTEGRHFTIDVAGDQLLTQAPPKRISDARLLSHYYNNHAVSAMLEGRLADAHAWMALAIAQDPEHASPWNNAGILAQRENDQAAAGRAFLRALAINPAHAGALANVIIHFQRIGDTRNAKLWRTRAEKALRNDPLHQFMLGYQAEQRGDTPVALAHYRRAARLDNRQLLFHLGVARMWLRIGDTARAGEALERVRSLDSRQGGRYQAKLEKLRQLYH